MGDEEDAGNGETQFEEWKDIIGFDGGEEKGFPFVEKISSWFPGGRRR